MRIKVCLWVLVATGIVLSGCSDVPAKQSSNALGSMSDSQQRMWQYTHAMQSGQASSLLDSPNDPPPSDQSLISQSKANYIQRGYDPKKAEQCAKEDFISATGRTPTSSF
jgi:uncharacterized protein YceK